MSVTPYTDLSHCDLCQRRDSGLTPYEDPLYMWPDPDGTGGTVALYQCSMHPWYHWEMIYSADWPQIYEEQSRDF